MVYVSSRETRPSREVSERSEEANRPSNPSYDALRETASSPGRVERSDGRSKLRQEAISKGKEKLDTDQREVRQLQMKDEEQLQAIAGASRSEHDKLITEHFHEANGNLDWVAGYRQAAISNKEISPNVISTKIIEHLDQAANALELANKANEREQQRLARLESLRRRN